jgi:hypothetical protein
MLRHCTLLLLQSELCSSKSQLIWLAHLMMCSVSQFMTIFSPKLLPISPGVGSRAPKSCKRREPSDTSASVVKPRYIASISLGNE